MLLKFIAGALFVLAFMLPNHYFPWSSFYNDFAMALCLLCLMIIALWEQKRRSLTIPLVAATLLLVAVIPLVQVVAGLLYFNSDGWIASFYLFGLTLAYCAAYLLARQTSPQQVARLLAWGLLVSAVLSVGVSLHQWLLVVGNIWVVDLAPRAFPYGNLGQPNNLVTLILVAWVALVYLQQQKKLGALGGFVVSLFLLFGAALTQSRTAFAILPFILLWWVWRGRGGRTSLGFPVLAVLLLSFVAFYFLIPRWTDAVHLNGIVEHQVDAKLGLRSILWQSLLHAVSERPWFGFGWNQVSIAQVSVAELYQGSDFVEHSHNLLIDLLVWNGIPLGFLLIVALGYWGVTRTVRCHSAESWFALAAIGCVIVHSLLEFPLDYAYFLIPVGLLAGLTDAQYPHKYHVRCPAWAGTVVTIAGGIFLALLFKENGSLESDHREMRFSSAGIVGARPGASQYSVVVLDGPREFIRYALTQAKPGASEEEIEWMRRVTYRNAYPPALFRYVLVLAFNDKQSEACVVLQKLRSLDLQGTMYPEAVRNLQLMEDAYPQLIDMCPPVGGR